MYERIGIADKKQEVKSQNPVLLIRRKTESSQSMNSPVDHILFLQRTIGNQAVARLIKSGALQAKLGIGQSGDVYEKEADRVAEHIMRMPDVSYAKDTRIQRKCPKCLRGLLGKDKKDEKLQAKGALSQPPQVTSHIESNINSLKGGGQPLPESSRAFFEPRFGRDFSHVRVHTGAKASEAAQAVNARAFTLGQNVVFGEGQYALETGEGRKLLAHELAHTMQQREIITLNPLGIILTRELVLQRVCNKTESFYTNSQRYCLDDKYSPGTHPGKRCYREIIPKGARGCPPGDQCCFGKAGEVEDSPDRASLADGRKTDGTCTFDGWCTFVHILYDYLPAKSVEFLEESARQKKECRKQCENLPWYLKGSCLHACSGRPPR